MTDKIDEGRDDGHETEGDHMSNNERSISLHRAWQRYLTLRAESDTLWAEADTLRMKADALWAEEVCAAHEGPVAIEWRGATWCLVDGTDAFTEDT